MPSNYPDGVTDWGIARTTREGTENARCDECRNLVRIQMLDGLESAFWVCTGFPADGIFEQKEASREAADCSEFVRRY